MYAETYTICIQSTTKCIRRQLGTISPHMGTISPHRVSTTEVPRKYHGSTGGVGARPSLSGGLAPRLFTKVGCSRHMNNEIGVV